MSNCNTHQEQSETKWEDNSNILPCNQGQLKQGEVCLLESENYNSLLECMKLIIDKKESIENSRLRFVFISTKDKSTRQKCCPDYRALRKERGINWKGIQYRDQDGCWECSFPMIFLHRHRISWVMLRNMWTCIKTIQCYCPTLATLC